MTKSDERNNQSNTGTVLFGAAMALVPFFVLLLASSFMVKRELLPEDSGTIIICVAAFIGALIGGAVAAKRIGRRYAYYGAAVGLTLFAARAFLAAIFSHGNFWGGTALPMLLCLVAGGFFGGLLSSRKPKRKRK
jgi:putative membrane protein (TIGR04086 family)